ncbi:MAG TPA: deoxyguanosinetriphosphate triphosphohydrolase [Candidatus Omnitrophota bacterium]|nr:deoxyguanosinetriphosphate triphosphohydrolase [Candidatus Omnitrophota bacterium]
MGALILKRKDLEDREVRELASYAVKSRFSRGRRWPEKEHDFRTAFQRDKDRVVHSTAFRRLEYKTQVFVNHEGDHYRTRLTHTLEVAQIARTIARVLRLNEDLVEAIALAHDLGHGPFGHAGEQALQAIMKKHGGFEHNRQSLRIVEELEESYAEFPGLNLTAEVLDGIQKHREIRFLKGDKDFPLSLEAQLVDIADEIAYDSHDVDDGLRSGFIEEADLASLKIWQEISNYVQGKYPRLPPGTPRKRLAIRLLINRQVEDLITQTQRNIESCGIRENEDLKKVRRRIVEFSAPMLKLKREWKEFLHEKLYRHYRVVRMTEKGVRMLKALFEVYLERPGQLPPSVLVRADKDGIYRAICDYVSGMTDRFAQEEHKKLFEPYEKV